MLLPDHASIGFSMSSRSLAYPGFVLSLFSQVRLDLSFLALEFAHLGASLLLQSISYSGFGLSVLDFLRLGFLLFIRSYACIDSSASMLGLSCTGFVFPLFMIDAVHSGFILFSQSLSCCESVMSTMDFLRLELLPLVQSFACSGSTAPVIGVSCSGLLSFLSLIDSAHFDFPPFLHGCA